MKVLDRKRAIRKLYQEYKQKNKRFLPLPGQIMLFNKEDENDRESDIKKSK